MVVCSKNWAGKVVALPEQSDREYIAKNSFYLYCDEPLWVEPNECHVSAAAALVAQDLILSRAYTAMVLVCLPLCFIVNP